MNPMVEHCIVRVDKPFVDKIKTKSGVDLYVDTTYNPNTHLNVVVDVIKSSIKWLPDESKALINWDAIAVALENGKNLIRKDPETDEMTIVVHQRNVYAFALRNRISCNPDLVLLEDISIGDLPEKYRPRHMYKYSSLNMATPKSEANRIRIGYARIFMAGDNTPVKEQGALVGVDRPTPNKVEVPMHKNFFRNTDKDISVVRGDQILFKCKE